jgi:hypothetical protein
MATKKRKRHKRKLQLPPSLFPCVFCVLCVFSWPNFFWLPATCRSLSSAFIGIRPRLKFFLALISLVTLALATGYLRSMRRFLGARDLSI